jgi:DNA repair photolyase
LARVLEPRTSSPEARLKAIRALSSAGIPVRGMLAPMIPGLTDHELPQLLEAVKEAGAGAASYIMLRLPHAVAPIFQQWLAEHRPLALPRIEGLIRGARGGALYKSEFGSRMKGQGAYAEHLRTTFQVFVKKLGLDGPQPELDCSQFRPPRDAAGQQRLF